MEISRIRALRGPNLWSRNTSIEAIVTCPSHQCCVDQLEGFEPRLRALFPGMGALRYAGQDLPVTLTDVLGLAALGLQAQAGCPVTFCRSAATSDEGVHQVVVQYSEEAVGRRAMALANMLVQAAIAGTPFDAAAAVLELRELDESERLGPSTGCIVDAAVARGIPFRRLTTGSLVQFGWGKRQRRIQAAEIDSTSAVSEAIAQDKDLTKKLLHAAGVDRKSVV